MPSTASPPRRASRAPWLVTLYAGGGEFCDGYILSIIGVALPLITTDLHLSAADAGLIGSASLIGMFLGGLVFGYVTDRIGRRRVYLADIAVFVLLSAAQFFVSESWQLTAVRCAMGVAIGADFAIAGTIASEFAPRKSRGPLLVALVTMWSLGAAVAYVTGWLMLRAGLDDWRLILASSTVPAFLVLLLRLRTPESPRWLLSRGREEEARAVLVRMHGSADELPELLAESAAAPARPPRYADIFRGGNGRRTLFVCLFWSCQLLPIYAITTYEPDILASFGLAHGPDAYLGAVFVQLFFVLGSLSGMLFVNRGRRPLLLWSFGLSVPPLLALSWLTDPSVGTVVALFAAFGLASFSSQCLQALYPSELFPTAIRGTANGFATGISRIGAAVGTYGAPMLLAQSTQLAMFAGGLIALVGCAAAFFLAPETRGLPLGAAGGSGPKSPAAAALSAPQIPTTPQYAKSGDPR
ncbi:MFS transporter [Streptomyces sp. NPDC005349]|uniref:MFS transporter n=1 Tax=Streptomyces sp. NPDC005349 TaxID=3157037 RepID=UPI00339EB972